jgi:maleylpyruvate isomerase
MTDPRRWIEDCTKVFLTALGRLDDADLNAPTVLPGWTRRHVVAHVHHNATALRRLVSWAATGRENPMYASPEQRVREIEQCAQLAAADLRRLVSESAYRLADDLDALPNAAWRAEVVTGQGRQIRAAEIPWLRVREVAVHAIDLDAGIDFDDLPAAVLEALLVDVVRRRAAGGEAAGLAMWLTGRTAVVPHLGPWL